MNGKVPNKPTKVPPPLTPTELSREGHRAFYNNIDIADCPYKDFDNAVAWASGWSRAQHRFDVEQKKFEDEENIREATRKEWLDFCLSCPWNTFGEYDMESGSCSANNNQECARENCAPLYILENR